MEKQEILKIIQKLLMEKAIFNKDYAEYQDGYKTAMIDLLVDLLKTTPTTNKIN